MILDSNNKKVSKKIFQNKKGPYKIVEKSLDFLESKQRLMIKNIQILKVKNLKKLIKYKNQHKKKKLSYKTNLPHQENNKLKLLPKNPKTPKNLPLPFHKSQPVPEPPIKKSNSFNPQISNNLPRNKNNSFNK